MGRTHFRDYLRLGYETLIIFLIIIIVQIFFVAIHVHLMIVTFSGRRHLPPDQVHRTRRCRRGMIHREFTTRALILLETADLKGCLDEGRNILLRNIDVYAQLTA
jgi:hypothetical protein